MSLSADRLEIVLRHVAGHLLAESVRLHVRRAEVQTRPDAGLDDLLERLREPVEVPRLARKAAAGQVEPDRVGTEEHLQHAQLGTVQTGVLTDAPGGAP